MDNQFDSKGGGPNVGIGKGAIGKQVNNFFCRLLVRIFTTGNQSPAIIADKGNVAVTYNTSGVPPEVFAQYVKELGATEQVIRGFLSTLLEHNVPREQWDRELREIACQHKALLASMGNDQAAKQAIEAGDYTKASALLEDIAKHDHDSLAAAEAYADNARLQRMQLRYDEAAKYWQRAVMLLPQESKKKRADYLNSAGHDLKRIYKYKDALYLYEQSLTICKEIGDRRGEGRTLNNIGKIYQARRDYNIALSYLEQSLVIRQEIGDKEGDAITSYNIGRVHSTQGDLVKAEQYISRAVQITEEIGSSSLKKYRKALETVRAKLWGR